MNDKACRFGLTKPCRPDADNGSALPAPEKSSCTPAVITGAEKRIGSKPLAAAQAHKIESADDFRRSDEIPAWALQQLHEANGSDIQQTPSRPANLAVFAAPDIAGRGSLTPLMTVGEAATLLRVSPKTVHRLVAGGELHRVRIGRSIRISADEIHRFVLQRSNA